MTKQEAKENFGRMVQSGVRLKRGIASNFDKEWRRHEDPVKGLLIGTRTYVNGYVEYNNYRYFVPKEYFNVALIVPSWRSNPVPVPLEECELVSGM